MRDVVLRAAAAGTFVTLGTCALLAARPATQGPTVLSVAGSDERLPVPAALASSGSAGVDVDPATGAITGLTAVGSDAVIPVVGITAAALSNSFGDPRQNGRRHAGIDIAAPRGTPVVAAMDGWLVALTGGGAGGRGLYLLDRTGRYLFYYAHLDAYVEGVWAGRAVRRSEVLGFVGTTGNAGDWPHLHLEVGRIREVRTLQVERLNPYEFLTVPSAIEPLVAMRTASDRTSP